MHARAAGNAQRRQPRSPKPGIAPPWQPRMIEIRDRAEIVDSGGAKGRDINR